MVENATLSIGDLYRRMRPSTVASQFVDSRYGDKRLATSLRTGFGYERVRKFFTNYE